MKDYEEKLIRKLKKGDKKAFEYFFNEYYDKLLPVAAQYLNDWDEAEEVTQEVFYRVWYYRENMESHLSFKAYINTIAKRLIYNKARQKVIKLTYEKYLKSKNQHFNNSLEEYLNFNELDRQINQRVQLLPPKRKEIFILSRQEGLSHKEIAQKLNISTNTVESQITKAIKFIKESLLFLTLICLF